VTATSQAGDLGTAGSDCVEIRGLRVEAVHGVGEAERRSPQPFEVDLDLYLDDGGAASRPDDLTATADYAAAIEVAAQVLEGRPRHLLETLAEEIAAAVLADPHLSAVTVWVRKLHPPVPRDLRSAAVRITRRRGR